MALGVDAQVGAVAGQADEADVGRPVVAHHDQAPAAVQIERREGVLTLAEARAVGGVLTA